MLIHDLPRLLGSAKMPFARGVVGGIIAGVPEIIFLVMGLMRV